MGGIHREGFVGRDSSMNSLGGIRREESGGKKWEESSKGSGKKVVKGVGRKK
jgi:hypothetical protein